MAERRIVKGWIVERRDDGSIVPIAPAESAMPPRDPTFDLKAPAAAAGIANTQANTARTQQATALDAENARIQRMKLISDLEKDGKQIVNGQVVPIPGWTPPEKRPVPPNPRQMQAARIDAANKLRTIGRINKNINNGVFPVGFGSETMRGIGGTAASNIEADLGQLRSGAALTELLRMNADLGKNPLAPMTDSDVRLLSENTGSLDQKQSVGNFRANLEPFKGAYRRAYVGAGGRMADIYPQAAPQFNQALADARANLERQIANLPEAAKRDARARFNSDPRVKTLMGGRGVASAPRKQAAPAVDDEVAGYLKKYGKR